MSNLYTASEYKTTIIDLLLDSDDFVMLMTPSSPPHRQISTKDMLLGGIWFINGKKYEEQGQVFDHNFVDDTTVDEKTFVFVETDIDNIESDSFIDFVLYVCIFTAKSLVRITKDSDPSIFDVEEMGYHIGNYNHGNRIDILCDVVDRILNRNRNIKGVGDIKPAPRGFCKSYSPNNKYYGKCLKYVISNYNEMDDDNCDD